MRRAEHSVGLFRSTRAASDRAMLALALGCSNVAIEVDGRGWWVNFDGQHARLVRLDERPTGECPCGCGSAAYPYTIEGSEGYVDAAPACATRLVADAVASGWLPVKP